MYLEHTKNCKSRSEKGRKYVIESEKPEKPILTYLQRKNAIQLEKMERFPPTPTGDPPNTKNRVYYGY